MLYDYDKERWYKVRVKGQVCLFNDYRIDRDTVPAGKYMYEVADDCDATPIRIRPGIMINFYGTIVSDEPLALDANGTVWLGDDDWEWVVE